MKSEPGFLGTVQSVQGSTVSIELSEETVSSLAFVEGYAYRIGQVGSFVRIPIGYTDLYGVVSQSGANAVPEKLLTTEPFGRRWITAELIGEGTAVRAFQRGLAHYPTYGDKAYLVTEPDLAKLYGHPDAPSFIKIGMVSSAENIPALLDANKLVTRHSAIVGATGSGKSTTVAAVVRAMTEQRFASARVVLLDLHGEYTRALADISTTFRISTEGGSGDNNRLFVPYWVMSLDELLPITFGELEGNARSSVAQRILEKKLATARSGGGRFGDPRSVTVDSPVPFSIHKLWLELFEEVNATHTAAATGQTSATIAYADDADGRPLKGDAVSVTPPRYKPQTQGGTDRIFLSGSTLNIKRQVDTLGARLRDPRLSFLFNPGDWLPNQDGVPLADLSTLLESWLSSPRAVSILDISGIPASILDELVGVLIQMFFDALFWGRNRSEGGRERPLLLVMEEAHTYLGRESLLQARAAVQRVVKEGRKYGVGAMIVSQRPAEIDPTILSQCGTIIAMRLSNTADRSQVTAAVTDNLGGLLAMLPTLRTGEAIVVGEAVHLPLRAAIAAGRDDQRPDSTDPLIFDPYGPGGWNRPREPANFGDVIRAWRDQSTTTEHSIEQRENPVQRQQVSSSTIASVGFDSSTSTLEIEFHDGRLYQYYDVPEHVYQALMGAASLGAYLSSAIKGTYRYARL